MITTMFLLGAAAAAATTAAPAAPADLDAWVSQVNQLLQHHMREPATRGTGLATIAFRRDADGRPVDIVVKSGSRVIAQAALATLRAVKVLPPMPATMPGNQRITFNFLVGDENHLYEYDRTRAVLQESANRTNMTLAARFGAATRLAALERR